jgi:oleate hydratase
MLPQILSILGLIGQYVEVLRGIAFTIECSVRSVWEAIYLLLKRGPAPPPVYQGHYDPKALFAALKVVVCQ